MKRLILAGSGSGCGKTTVTMAVLSALLQAGEDVRAFKCGPDYIDPMFHSAVTGVPCRNLDSVLCGDDTVRYLFSKNAGAFNLIEGVMGYYDGPGSAYELSGLFDAPAVLVLDCKGMGESLGALMQGFLRYRTDSRICGFLFNRLSPAQEPLAKRLCAELSCTYFGYLPYREEHRIESRHLGLVTAAELSDLKERVCSLGALARETVNLEALCQAARADLEKPDKSCAVEETVRGRFRGLRIGIAHDAAFCFTYADNLDLLSLAGCELCFFSPLSDRALPPALDGLYLCGGYPELYAKALSENEALKTEIARAVRGGLPTIAECGGFLYLGQSLADKTDERFPMAGVLRTDSFPTKRLQRFGYVTLSADTDTLLLKRGETVRAHEFHYYDSTDCGSTYGAEKLTTGASYRTCHASDTLYAGFPHLHFYGRETLAANFLERCAAYHKKRTKEQNGTTN